MPILKKKLGAECSDALKFCEVGNKTHQLEDFRVFVCFLQLSAVAQKQIAPKWSQMNSRHLTYKGLKFLYLFKTYYYFTACCT